LPDSMINSPSTSNHQTGWISLENSSCGKRESKTLCNRHLDMPAIFKTLEPELFLDLCFWHCVWAYNIQQQRAECYSGSDYNIFLRNIKLSKLF
jgi:hypothetical protein